MQKGDRGHVEPKSTLEVVIIDSLVELPAGRLRAITADTLDQAIAEHNAKYPQARKVYCRGKVFYFEEEEC